MSECNKYDVQIIRHMAKQIKTVKKDLFDLGKDFISHTKDSVKAINDNFEEEFRDNYNEALIDNVQQVTKNLVEAYRLTNDSINILEEVFESHENENKRND